MNSGLFLSPTDRRDGGIDKCANLENKAGYTAEQSRAIGQEQKYPIVTKKYKKSKVITDRRTDQPTDQHTEYTDRHS